MCATGSRDLPDCFHLFANDTFRRKLGAIKPWIFHNPAMSKQSARLKEFVSIFA